MSSYTPTILYGRTTYNLIPESDWEEYKKRRKELSLSAERYRVEIRELKERIRQLEEFLLYLPSGGRDEKDYVGTAVSTHPGSFGFSEPKSHSLPISVWSCYGARERDRVVYGVGADAGIKRGAEICKRERHNVAPGAGDTRIRRRFPKIGRINYGDLSFPVVCRPEAVDYGKLGTVAGRRMEEDVARCIREVHYCFQTEHAGARGLSTEAGMQREREL